MYHAESCQEDFLVLSGTCLLLIEERACLIFMTGARREGKTIIHPRSTTARAHNAGVETDTNVPAEAYAPFTPWRLRRPHAWADLPWA